MLGKNSKLIKELEENINYKFKNLELFKLALTHSSYSKRNKNKISNNQRLEFLGDSVLELIVNEYLYHQLSLFSEGEMTKIKSLIVSKKILTKWANSIFLGKYIILGRGEDHTGGRKKASILSGNFEALLGAIYLDGGFKKAKIFILSFLKDEMNEVTKVKYVENYKSLLQEMSQKKYKCLPKYEVIKEKGPDHKKYYCITVKLKQKKYGSGFGENKKEAEKNAAKDALEKLKII
ncbi:MAG: ribonuclease III [Candidatus Caldatribacteriota bacterium]|nr:ribonuclease III [Candidatus Caldatribacteriota bacterium]